MTNKFRKTTQLLLLISLSFYMFACQGKSLKHLSPIKPPLELSEEITLNTEGKQPEISMTKESITASTAYWRKYDLNLKYNRSSMTSPFFYQDAWHQGEKVDVFYVTIKNNRTTPIIFDVSVCKTIDQGDNEYGALSYRENRQRLESKKGHDITIENGLKKSKQILLEMNVADGEIDPGETVKGFIPFRQVKSRAKDLKVQIVVETTPEKVMERYKKVVFDFPFTHDLAIRIAQPATMRF